MNIFEAILFGAVQGLTEYLPISSSAHLALLPRFLGRPDPGLSFDVVLHLGTLAATVLFFRREWLSLLKALPTREGKRQAWSIALATLPALMTAAVFRSVIAESLRGPPLIAGALILGGLVLVLVDRWSRGRHGLEDVTPRRALIVGFFQCLALVPGMSRSGSTILGARAVGLSREAAARFSFFISAPITAAAVASELLHWPELLASMGPGSGLQAGFTLLVGALSAFVFGWIAISGLIRWVSRVGFEVFAVYRLALGIVVLFWLS